MGNAFFESEDTGVFKDNKKKLFASYERHIDNHTLMLNMLHSNILVVCTCHKEVSLKTFFWCGYCSLLIFVV